jgi:pimeloyl-ACP methyl ester carboxylesterase
MDDDTLTPFHLEVPQADLDDLAARLDAARWPDPLPAQGWTRGVPVDWLRELAAYWRDGYDWRAQERRINAFPQVTTVIDGQRVHALHVRSPEPGALPLVLTHGWPGSIVEFLDLIGPLTDPRAHGGDPADAFHVVVPSLPGFGLSGPVHEPGWTATRIAGAWATLMARLGYTRYGAQGGDVGAAVTIALGRVDPEHVVALHVNGEPGPMATPPFDPAETATLTEAERGRLAHIEQFMQDEFGYIVVQSTRPQTLAFGLTDSPVGQLAWIAEKFQSWTWPADAPPEDKVDRDTLLTNVMLYWLTRTAGSSALVGYAEAEWGQEHARGTVPTGVAVFAFDTGIRRYAEPAHTITRWAEFDTGGHFAALEQPDLLLAEVRAFFRDARGV